MHRSPTDSRPHSTNPHEHPTAPRDSRCRGWRRGKIRSRRRRSIPGLRLTSTLLLVVASILAAASASAQTLSVEETELLVRTRYFEGMPEAEAARIGPEGAARLVEMLADPEEKSSHAQILLALGLCGSPDALAAIRRWQSEGPLEGEIDRDRFRAWQALPYALSHLARFDRRAIVDLEALMNAGAPGWTFRHHVGARLLRENRRAVATSLAMTGLPEARRILDRVARSGNGVSDPEFARHLQELRSLRLKQPREVGR